MKKLFQLTALFCALFSTATLAQEKPTLWLIGDSTVNNGTKGQMGWGQVIAPYFDPAKINVVNRARGGRSSRTFYTEGLWDAVLKDLKAGDFVLMQFGHNDGGSLRQSTRASLKGNGEETEEYKDEKTGKTETVHTYGWYLRKYIADAKNKVATPIVLSLIPRNDWKEGKVMRAFPGYGQMSKDAAQTGGAAFIDLNAITADKYDTMGEAAVKPFFPNEHTHTNEAGAQINAQSVVEGLLSLKDVPFAPYLSDKGRALVAAKTEYVVNVTVN